MRNPRASNVLLLILLLLGAGCRREAPIDSTPLNEAEWEKSLRDPSLDEKAFTRLYARAVAANLKDAQVQVVGPKEISVKPAGGGSLKVFTDNAWAEAAQNPAARPEICRRYLQGVMEAAAGRDGSSRAPDTNSIVLLVRDDDYVQNILRAAAATTNRAENRLVFEPLAADIKIVYAMDRKGSIAALMERDRAALGIGLPELRRLSVENLHRLLPNVERQGAGPVFTLVADGNYESSLLLADAIWDGLGAVVRGDVVAAVPSRGVLMFTGSASPEGLDELRRKVQIIFDNGDHVISKALLVRRNGHWEVFKN